MKQLAIRLSAVAGVAHCSATDGKCRILSLKGGGVHGAWESGCLKAVIDQMEAEEVKYDIVAGVSIGAINASVFALHPPGEEKEAASEIASFYTQYTPDDLYNLYSPWFVAPFTQVSMADNSEMLDKLAR